MKEFYFTTNETSDRLVFVSLLEEIEDTRETFRNYLTIRMNKNTFSEIISTQCDDINMFASCSFGAVSYLVLQKMHKNGQVVGCGTGVPRSKEAQKHQEFLYQQTSKLICFLHLSFFVNLSLTKTAPGMGSCQTSPENDFFFKICRLRLGNKGSTKICYQNYWFFQAVLKLWSWYEGRGLPSRTIY